VCGPAPRSAASMSRNSSIKGRVGSACGRAGRGRGRAIAAPGRASAAGEFVGRDRTVISRGFGSNQLAEHEHHPIGQAPRRPNHGEESEQAHRVTRIGAGIWHERVENLRPSCRRGDKCFRLFPGMIVEPWR